MNSNTSSKGIYCNFSNICFCINIGVFLNVKIIGKLEIDNFRVELRKLTKSKNIYNYLLTVLEEVSIDALRQAKKKSGLNCFLQTCPYSIEQILNVDYLPPFIY
ncbi:DUF29 family protein [Nostoc sp.]|uniref:DUF29 family protein n=1 Tax=Nostoc sp. TaxID=1180 RepID=UPI002FF8C717